jgi:hypothetical protein
MTELSKSLAETIVEKTKEAATALVISSIGMNAAIAENALDYVRDNLLETTWHLGWLLVKISPRFCKLIEETQRKQQTRHTSWSAVNKDSECLLDCMMNILPRLSQRLGRGSVVPARLNHYWTKQRVLNYIRMYQTACLFETSRTENS